LHEFRLWAPRAHRVSVKTETSTYPMLGPDEQGNWSAQVKDAQAGTRYGFLLDDDQTVYPDPRSLVQVGGDVHGWSELYQQKAFHWNDASWQGPPLSGAVVYELHVGTFTTQGTFDAAISRLPYLFDLGITHVEVMPIAEFAGDRGWGYDGVALFAVTQHYGGADAFKRFVDACHLQGLAVILDVVYNHFGPVGNYTGKFGPYVTAKHHTPWGDAINFEDAGSDAVRQFFLDNARMWLRDFHVDGLRLDAVHEIMDRSAVHFLEQLSADVDVLSARLGRRLILIAESDLNNPQIVRPIESGGYGLDAQWSDDFHHSLFTLLHVEEGNSGYYTDFGSFECLAKSLKSMFVYDGIYSSFRHRSHGRPVDRLSAHHFIGFIQNHDQVGNRATGDRLEHIVGLDLAKVALGLVLTAPSIPMLFQGEEYAASTPFLYFADHDDEEMAKAVAAGRKKEFAAFSWDESQIPNPEERSTFENSRLNWSEAHTGKHAEMLAWTKALIRLRRGSIALNDGDLGHLKVSFDEEHRWLRMDRGKVSVFANLGGEEVEFQLKQVFWLALASNTEATRLDGQRLVIPGKGFVVLSTESQD
jgi:maltooligosyltrehalose trehalohydrolase